MSLPEEDSKEGTSVSKEKEDKQLAVCQDVKSTAVVKYANMETPAPYQELQRNTDLNQPPANWLHDGSKWESYLRDLSLGKDHSFTSFKMAHCFPDLAGEIDIISDSENIKKLLKIPYSKGHVSMMVHRVGQTLLLDDFDIHKHLLRQQQDDWAWLRKFYENVIIRNVQQGMKDKIIVKKNKSRDHLQSRNMFSKFLYRSVIGQEGLEKAFNQNMISSQEGRVEPLETTTIPDPLTKPELDQAEHQRTLVWNFEDLRMLIGTDLPIFGGRTHPCVSLRLRDMLKPINVLTGLDYWLDNLICNVPEIAMCYHLNGIVQNYELLKTEDIPTMDGSKFSPKLVKDIAQNILSFLKSNATKEGHTYWLFKGHDDDIVKLYDLTDLCEDVTSEPNANPFTVPVGILLYRVARNMRQNAGRKKSGTIRTLLENCLLLLDRVTHSQVVTSAHYLLSDLYISDNIYNQELTATSSDDESDEDEHNDDEDEDANPSGEEARSSNHDDDPVPNGDESLGLPSSSVEVKALCVSENWKRVRKQLVRHPPISGGVTERCEKAHQHIAAGLLCLDESASQKSKPASKHTVEDQVSADPNQPIPLHYAAIHHPATTTGATYPPQPAASSNSGRASSPHQISVITRTSLPQGTWHVLSKTLLMRKAAVAYLGLAEVKVKQFECGAALKYLRLALSCFCAMRHLMPSKEAENSHLLVALLGLSGDIHLMLAHNIEKYTEYRNQYQQLSEQDVIIQASTERDLPEFEYSWLSEVTNNMSHNLKRCVLCYELALDVMSHHGGDQSQVHSLTKRLGNVQNELGVHYMNQATASLTQNGSGELSAKMQELWHYGYSCFMAGIAAFDSIADHVNMALLHSNCGRLMRLCAQAHIKYDDTGQRLAFNPEERHFYIKAAEQYLQGLGLIEHKEPYTGLWSSVSWELCSTYFNWATLLQDHAPLSSSAQEEVEKDVTELMTKALKYCESDLPSPRQPTCQYRAGIIHHRLASLYHNAYRNQISDQKKKHQRTLAELHYAKAAHYFMLVDSPCEMLRVQLERVAMGEFQLAGQTSPTNKLRTLQASLRHLTDCAEMLAYIHKQLTDPGDAGAELVESYNDELNKLIAIVETRLKFTLLNMVRCAAPSKKSKSSDSHQVAHYKAVYAAVLKCPSTTELPDLTARCLTMLQTLRQVIDMNQHFTHRSAQNL